MNISEASDINLGNINVLSIYLGNILLWPDIQDPTIPLTLLVKSQSSGTISFRNKATNPVYYKKNNEALQTISSGTTGVINVSSEDIVSFYGNNSSYYIDENVYSRIDCSCSCYIYGNMMSLISKDEYIKTKSFTSENVFSGLFASNQNIYSHPSKRILLPATTLTNGCYRGLFYQCKNLTAGPAVLPAKTVYPLAYYSMFRGSGIVKAPIISATYIGDQGCVSMFEDCTSLTTSPKFYSLRLDEACYMYMFQNCTSLVKAPKLPATTLAKNCYISMFSGCTSLVEAPELPATTLAGGCYYRMFDECTSLTIAPLLPATTLAEGCYGEMFRGCTSLTTVSELPATTLAERCYGAMFINCISLINVPFELPATILTSGCYYRMFKGCTSLTTASNLPATTLAQNCYGEMFCDCSNLNSIKCLATNNIIENSIHNWVYNVAANGTFTKKRGSSITGPSGWTVIEVD